MSSKTIIIATLGPSSRSAETLKSMIESGMDMARLNFSWGTYEEHHNFIENIRSVATSLLKSVPIIIDLSGPRVKEDDGHHIDANSIKTITEKDLSDIDFGIKENVEYFAMSYVKSASDILELKNIIKEKGGNQKVIAKIETKEAVSSLEEIIKNSDMVMVARGDLGNEFPLEEIPFVEKKIIKTANDLNVPVIVATQMLLSMIKNKEPTRAEVTDEVFAILEGAQGVMLSEETATGENPVEAVSFMERIANNTEKNI